MRVSPVGQTQYAYFISPVPSPDTGDLLGEEPEHCYAVANF